MDRVNFVFLLESGDPTTKPSFKTPKGSFYYSTGFTNGFVVFNLPVS